ncbi:uracil-DNA glycosylase family protein [Limibacter armeniacum]|uniref:uracil-DNA glycosylase family protein n=1 Tax=Limibacter armeniacum TaxID=466084 RepID=UPI002FE6A6F9
MEALLKEVSACTVCEKHLPFGVRPVVSLQPDCKILLISQAPGMRVHQSGIPWDDLSGNRLREWLDVSDDVFYDTTNFGVLPMGFCYPGKGKSGDLPPRKECAPLWHPRLLESLKQVKLTVLIGQYAQKYYLKGGFKSNLTKTVKEFDTFLPNYFPLPHPSPRNGIWLRKNSWFEEDVIPCLQSLVKEILAVDK